MRAKQLWTGETPRQWLLKMIVLHAVTTDVSISAALEMAIGDGDNSPDGSPQREGLRWWDQASTSAQQRILRDAKSQVSVDDRLAGRRIAR